MQSSDTKFDQSITVLLFVAFLCYSVISVLIGSPIFGGDEYAYFISGKYVEHLSDLYKLDPGLQRVSNFIYFKVVNLLGHLPGYELVHTLRILQSATYVLTAAILYLTFRRIVDRESAFWGVLLFLLLPNAIYIFAVMPEVALVFLAACLGYVLINIFSSRPYVGSAMAGLVIGAALLIKPHAVAMLGAAILTVSAAPFLGLVKEQRFAAIRAASILLVACYVSVVLLCWICGQGWIIDPSVVLSLNTYGQFIDTSLPQSSFGAKALNAAQYAAGHIAVMALIFAPVLVWSVRRLLIAYSSKTANEAPVSHGCSLAALFVLAMLATHIAMTAWFTAGAAVLNAGEAMRLHGRYLGVVIVFFPLLYFHAIQNWHNRDEMIVKVVILISIVTCFVYVFKTFKIFPWDHPLLFAFFTAPNHYGWNYDGGSASVGLILIGIMAVASMAMILFKPILYRVLFFQIFAICLAGNFQTYGWVFSHLKSTGYLTEYSRALSTIIGNNQFGKGLLVSDERHGRAAYVLFGLGNAPKVLMKKPGSVVSAADTLGADWVVLDREYDARFDYLHAITFGPFRFFPMNTGASVEQREKRSIKPGEQIRLHLGSGRHAPSNLKRFNNQEVWGAWTSDPSAEILLPVMLQGTITLKLFGWTLPENLKEPLLVRVGSNSSKILLTDAGKEFEVAVNVTQPSDRIILESPIFHPANSHRKMGVAISVISIERAPQ